MSIERLHQLREENDNVRAEMLVHAHRFEAIKTGEKPRAVTSFNLFQTPVKIAEKMASMIPEIKNPVILEPSAGLGRLYDATFKRFGESAKYHLVENNPDCMKELYNKNLYGNLHQRSFFDYEPPFKFDIIIMNPPFKHGSDIKHILHAKSLLKQGGFLISLCYNGVKQNKILKPISKTWEVLPKESFKSEGTRASVVLLTIANKRG